MQAFTTGAYIVPKEIDGTWFWVVESFEDDTFQNGDLVNVTEQAGTKEGLFPAVFFAISDEEGVLLHSGLNSQSEYELFLSVAPLLEDATPENFEDLVAARNWFIIEANSPFKIED